MSNQNYRCYHFANMYLPAQHSGIQSQHCLAEMFVKYGFDAIYFDQERNEYKCQQKLYTWAIEDKTTIVLNGGMSGDLQKLVELFSSEDNPYPWAYFKETEYALSGALTSVGIILPEKVYTYDKIVKTWEDYYHLGGEEPSTETPTLSAFELEIVEALRGKRLMS